MATKTVKFWVEIWVCDCGVDNLVDNAECHERDCRTPWRPDMESTEIEVSLDLPADWEVCECCGGEGTTYLGWRAEDQPAFTSEDFYDEGPDFEEDYFSGAYDRECPECKGRTTTLEISWDSVNEKDPMIAAYMASVESDAEYEAMCRAERRMGA